jgi:hypothetical protein
MLQIDEDDDEKDNDAGRFAKKFLLKIKVSSIRNNFESEKNVPIFFLC